MLAGVIPMLIYFKTLSLIQPTNYLSYPTRSSPQPIAFIPSRSQETKCIPTFTVASIQSSSSSTPPTSFELSITTLTAPVF